MKEQLKQLKEEFKKGNLKPSQLKKSKSESDLPSSNLPANQTQPRRNSIDLLSNPESLTKLLNEAQDQISILELKLETQERELSELNSLTNQNNHLKAQVKTKQQTVEELRKLLAETNQQLALATNELDNSLIARHANLKDWDKEHSKRQAVEAELNETIEEASEEITQQDQTVTNLRTQLFKGQQRIQELQRELNLMKIKGSSLRIENNAYVPEEFNSSLTYFKYTLYALLAVWFLLFLRKNHD